MQDIQNLRQQLKEEGFVHIFEWKDALNTEYDEHAHKGAVTIYILEGGLTFYFDNEEILLNEGERFDVPVGRSHRALVGSRGCHYLVGEMIHGDS